MPLWRNCGNAGDESANLKWIYIRWLVTAIRWIVAVTTGSLTWNTTDATIRPRQTANNVLGRSPARPSREFSQSMRELATLGTTFVLETRLNFRFVLSSWIDFFLQQVETVLRMNNVELPCWYHLWCEQHFLHSRWISPLPTWVEFILLWLLPIRLKIATWLYRNHYCETTGFHVSGAIRLLHWPDHLHPVLQMRERHCVPLCKKGRDVA